MRSHLKKKLLKAAELMDQAEAIINEVKNEFYDDRDRNDEYYGLEDVEVNLSNTTGDLRAMCEPKPKKK